MRSFAQWQAPLPDGGTSEESALVFNQMREKRLLVLPALFDEANKLRRLTVEIMRRLDMSGVDSFLPDLPGCNDSLQPLHTQTLANWQHAAAEAGKLFDATHVLSFRSGALLAPSDVAGWQYAPQGGKSLIRSMMRARSIAAREAGREETLAGIEASGRQDGINLAGWRIGPELFAALADADKPGTGAQTEIAQAEVAGGGLWLRAEPDEDHEQADAIAAIVAVGVAVS
ncbi:hypothetical protein [Pontixanthobacter luteolus]|uniref:hypothetical protein n=1 Tax=Pontixanthobacter luteolus TaxID=295089 RepID=UPI0023033B14|nr:hypothetical protein [Pontixanthobacter luteolus]